MDLKKSKFTVTNKPLKATGQIVEIVVLYADIRNFSEWANSASPVQVAELVEIEYERVVQLAQDYKHSFHKFLGDGFLLIWETSDFGSIADALHFATGAAFEIHKKYWYVSKDLGYCAPKGLGVGIACGKAVKVLPETFIKELNELDFVGYPMNCGARLQSLSGPYGVVLDSNGVEAAAENSGRVLRNGNSVLELSLLDPTPKALEKASSLKGLTKRDRLGFKYLIWPELQNKLWITDGRI
ncbi:MAG: adenylate/guanylate cyclase domain-containing protein [Candidatus Omnitrophota bacterium]|nr:adenylate/guanylate cyclase domain-containing protein [Candidatus Omnitrophota bacterium]